MLKSEPQKKSVLCQELLVSYDAKQDGKSDSIESVSLKFNLKYYLLELTQ